MKYTMVVSTRDIMAKHLHTASALQKLIGWQALFESLLPHLSDDVDDTPEGMHQYIGDLYTNGLDDCPLSQSELTDVSKLFSELLQRLRKNVDSFHVDIPKGFVYDVRIERWVGLDLELAFVYTQPSYSVGGQS
jgi:hypothetical protein